MVEDNSILGKLLPAVEHQVVQSDSMDTKMFNDLKERSGSLKEVEKVGTEALKTFPPLAQDIWSSLFKFDPTFRGQEEMTSSHRFNATLMEKMTQMTQYKELRVHTRLDDLHSAMATVALAEEITKSLKGELKEQADLANSADLIQKELERLANAAQTWQEAADRTGRPDFKKMAEDCLKAAELHKAQLKAAMEKLGGSCTSNVNKIRTNVRAAADSALKNAQSVSQSMDGWGLDAGQVQKMPIEQKLELAKRLQTEKFKLMAQVIGRMRRLAVYKQKTKLNQARDEIYDIGLGSDLSRVLPAELVLLGSPTGKGEFRRRFVEEKLMQYELRGTEKQGKGPIIVCVDNCLHPDTPVLMSDGTIRRIQEIREGDMVLSFDFRNSTTVSQRVGRVAQTKSPERLLMITTSEGSITCTPEHRFFTAINNKVIEVQAADLRGGDLIASPRRLPGQQNSEDGRIWAQLVGYLLGDGDKWHDKDRCSKRIRATDKDMEHIECYADIASQLGYKPLVRQWGGRNRLYINSAELYNTLELELPGLLSRSPQRTIPERILGWSNELLCSFIRGLYDAEGCVTDHQIVLTTSSKDIVDRLQTLLKRFSIVTEKETKGSGFRDHDYHRLTISDRQSIESFSTLIGFSGSDKGGKLALVLKRQRSQGGRAQVVPVDLRTILQVARSVGIVYSPRSSRGFGTIQYRQQCKNVSRARVKQIVSDIEGRVLELEEFVPKVYDKELRTLIGMSHVDVSKGTGLTIRQLRRLAEGHVVEDHKEVVLKYILQETMRRVAEARAYLMGLGPVISDGVLWTKVRSIEGIESNAITLYDLTMDGGSSNYLTSHYIVHNSGSMAGDRETWSKAVALALLEIASMQKRAFACIHFGSQSDELKVIEIEPGDKDILIKAIGVAEYFLNASGTAFEPALSKVTELISKQGFQNADLVFITDGNAPISDVFLKAFLEQKKARDYQAFGVLIQSSFDETIGRFCDKTVEVAELLDAEAEPLLEI